MDDSPNAPGAGPPPDCVPLRLVLQPGGAVIEVFRPEALVGRHSTADVRLPLPDVSRRHCRLQWVEGCWQVFDLNSLNGVYVNDEAVLQAPLHAGDLLRVGGFTFAVELPAAPEPEPEESLVRSIFQLPAHRPPSSHQQRRAS
jgi:pSer/pThr/pTyr-binding forkhead associated (FHA) protein